MTAPSFTIENAAVVSALKKLSARIGNTSAPMREIGSSLVDLVRLTFTDSRDPYGNPWRPLSESGLLSRLRRHTTGGLRTKRGNTKAKVVKQISGNVQPLLDTGKLRNSMTFKSGNGFAEVAPSDFEGKALLHQFGSRKQSGRGSGVPARPYLPIRGSQVDLPISWQVPILNIIQKHINKI